MSVYVFITFNNETAFFSLVILKLPILADVRRYHGAGTEVRAQPHVGWSPTQGSPTPLALAGLLPAGGGAPVAV